MELYKIILTSCKGSYFTAESRKNFRKLRGDFKNKENNFFDNIKNQ